ncbi:MAG: His/Gly/Thr/Pro-type tRNA ligase C-terminal domain-containing protein [Verrucomicrobiales bacterium]
MAARHRAGGLQPAGALRARIHRAGQQTAPPGHDPPRALRQHGAVLRRPHRALRRALPGLARARAGPRPAGQRKVVRLRPRGRVRPAHQGVRVKLDESAEKVGAKIRDAQLAKTPYMLVIGPKESENREVAVRHSQKGDLGAMPLDAFVDRIGGEIRERSL